MNNPRKTFLRTVASCFPLYSYEYAVTYAMLQNAGFPVLPLQANVPSMKLKDIALATSNSRLQRRGLNTFQLVRLIVSAFLLAPLFLELVLRFLDIDAEVVYSTHTVETYLVGLKRLNNVVCEQMLTLLEVESPINIVNPVYGLAFGEVEFTTLLPRFC